MSSKLNALWQSAKVQAKLEADLLKYVQDTILETMDHDSLDALFNVDVANPVIKFYFILKAGSGGSGSYYILNHLISDYMNYVKSLKPGYKLNPVFKQISFVNSEQTVLNALNTLTAEELSVWFAITHGAIVNFNYIPPKL